MAEAFPAARLSRLTLGTVQLGLAYGVANRAGLPSAAEARAILDAAASSGIVALDTARAYGAAEARIGAWLAARPAAAPRPILISKFPRLPPGAGAERRRALDAAWRETTAALGVSRLDGYLAHAPADLDDPAIRDWLADKAASGTLGAWGASVYDPAEARRALAAGARLLQAPISVLDRRVAVSGVLDAARAAGALVFARSLFLQGALLMPPGALPPHLAALAPVLVRLAALAREAGRGVVELALVAVRDTAGIASLVVGVERADQLAPLVAAAASPALDPGLAAALAALARTAPAAALDPRSWPKA